jgi:hypothetical protein
MSSKAFTRGNFLNPPSSPEGLAKDEKSFGYRHPTVYDAVEGPFRN